MRGPSGATRHPQSWQFAGGGIHGQETMDNVRSGGRRHDAGRRMLEQHHVAVTSRVRAQRAPRAAERSAGGARTRRRGGAGAAGGSRAGRPDRLHRAGHGTRRRQAVQRQDGLDPDPVDRWRGRRTSPPPSPTSRRRPASRSRSTASARATRPC